MKNKIKLTLKTAKVVKKLREQKGWSQKELADRAGIYPQIVQSIEAGKADSSKYLYKIAQPLGSNVEFLLTGQERFSVDITVGGQQRSISQNPYNPCMTPSVPIIQWSELTKMKRASNADKKRDFVQPVGSGTDTIAVILNGDSMASPDTSVTDFRAGDTLYFDPDLTPENGDFVLYYSKNSGAVFRQYILDGSSNIYLKPLNPQYPLLKLKTTPRFIGVLVSCVKNFKHCVKNS